jgi:hypothetical protein
MPYPTFVSTASASNKPQVKLPRPTEKLAGCVWLPRILAKARQLQGSGLPPDYAASFCNPKGVDGVFLAHFGLNRDDILSTAALTDEKAAEWFLSRTTAERIAQWNHTALNLGRPSYPIGERFPLALATTYQHVDSRGLTTVFEVLEADEKDS